jgi:hypothetical protein
MSLQFKFVSVVQESIEHGIGDSWFAEVFMPVGYGEL